jgi:CheY-like chemotaxis protein
MDAREDTTKRILIVEDDPLSRKLARDALAAHGYEIEEVANGADALSAAAASAPDLVVMDISLPGIDGLETTRRLKALPGGRDIPVLAVTAHAMRGDEERALAEGCAAYMTKPLKFAEFVREVGRLLGG